MLNAWLNPYRILWVYSHISTFVLCIKKGIRLGLLEYIVHQQSLFMAPIHWHIPLCCQKVCQATETELTLKIKVRASCVYLFFVFKDWMHIPLYCLCFELFRFYYVNIWSDLCVRFLCLLTNGCKLSFELDGVLFLFKFYIGILFWFAFTLILTLRFFCCSFHPSVSSQERWSPQRPSPHGSRSKEM